MTQAGAWITCRNCGTSNAPHEQFCVRCGYSLVSSATTRSATSAPPGLVGRRITGALAAGIVINGRYRVVQLVGKGGFGAVYKASDERFQAKRIVAVKEMSDAQLNPKEKAAAQQAFRQEAELLVPLSHPNLPQVSDFFEESGKAYLVMEFVEGETLEKLQEDAQGPLDERRVMGWVVQLCDVLDYLHTQQPPIIFRDLKPGNIMLTKYDQVKLIDFGIARVFKSTSSKDTTLLGSRGYAPLEQYGRGQSDARSDIYALGATLYDLLTFSTPADAPSRQINPSVFTLPRQANPRISPDIEQIILKAMQTDPQQRYQSAQEMLEAILTSGVVQPSKPLPIISRGYQGQSIPVLPVQPQPTTPPLQNGSTIQSGGQTQVGTMASSAPPARNTTRRAVLIAGLALVAGGGGYAAYRVFTGSRPSTQQQSGSGSQKPTEYITIPFFCSTEKQGWLDAALQQFTRSGVQYNGKGIQVTAQYGGSLEFSNGIVQGTSTPPVAWTPASTIEVNRFLDSWKEKHPDQVNILVNNEQKSLVESPLVFAVWNDRAQVLLKKYQKIDWDTLHTALKTNGWTDIGGPTDWGKISFSQTKPDSSNSGLLTLILMLYVYRNNPRRLTVSDVDEGFLKYMNVFEDAVNTFGRSSGTYLSNEILIKGPAAYNIIATYENLVLSAQPQVKARHPGLDLLPFYPSINIVSDHPFVLFNHSGINAEQQAAAKILRDFLLDKPQQQLALHYGLRPVNQDVHITDSISNNLFTPQNQVLAQRINMNDIVPVQLPDSGVVSAILQKWSTTYSTFPVGNG